MSVLNFMEAVNSLDESVLAEVTPEETEAEEKSPNEASGPKRPNPELLRRIRRTAVAACLVMAGFFLWRFISRHATSGGNWLIGDFWQGNFYYMDSDGLYRYEPLKKKSKRLYRCTPQLGSVAAFEGGIYFDVGQSVLRYDVDSGQTESVFTFPEKRKISFSILRKEAAGKLILEVIELWDTEKMVEEPDSNRRWYRLDLMTLSCEEIEYTPEEVSYRFGERSVSVTGRLNGEPYRFRKENGEAIAPALTPYRGLYSVWEKGLLLLSESTLPGGTVRNEVWCYDAEADSLEVLKFDGRESAAAPHFDGEWLYVLYHGHGGHVTVYHCEKKDGEWLCTEWAKVY